jgi:hypothetical protein
MSYLGSRICSCGEEGMTQETRSRETLDNVHRRLMQWPAWKKRLSSIFTGDSRPLDERIVDFLDCNSGIAFTVDAIADHVNCCGGLERGDLYGALQKLVREDKIDNFLHHRDLIHFYASNDKHYRS